MKHKDGTKEDAIRLRLEEKKSLLEISLALGIAKSTASLWLRDIPLSREITHRNGSGKDCKFAKDKREERRGYQEEGRKMAKTLGSDYAYGCMLYWAEGAKSKNTVSFCNGDPEMMAFFVGILRKYFGCTENDLKFSVMAHTGDGLESGDIEKYWSEKIGIPLSRCGKFTLKTKYYPRPTGKLRKPYGCCTVRVSCTKIVQSIYGSIQELMGIDRPEWLD